MLVRSSGIDLGGNRLTLAQSRHYALLPTPEHGFLVRELIAGDNSLFLPEAETCEPSPESHALIEKLLLQVRHISNSPIF